MLCLNERRVDNTKLGCPVFFMHILEIRRNAYIQQDCQVKQKLVWILEIGC